MKIEVLGIGCANCAGLYTNVREAVRSLGITAEIIKVGDIAEIMNRGVMLLPALFVNGEVKVVGRVASVEEITTILKGGE